MNAINLNTIDMNALDFALGLLCQRQAEETRSIPEPAKVIPMRPKQREDMRTEQNSVPRVKPDDSFLFPLPPVGSIGAKQFLHAVNHAGTGTTNQRQGFSPSERKNIILAIAGYVGYNRAADFGPQLFRATQKAHSELKKPYQCLKLRPVQGEVGHVFGAANLRQKRLDDLLAREAMTAELIEQYRLDSLDTSKTESERKYAAGLIGLEVARLDYIRRDIQLYS